MTASSFELSSLRMNYFICKKVFIFYFWTKLEWIQRTSVAIYETRVVHDGTATVIFV